jgi:hypothetical protein
MPSRDLKASPLLYQDTLFGLALHDTAWQCMDLATLKLLPNSSRFMQARSEVRLQNVMMLRCCWKAAGVCTCAVPVGYSGNWIVSPL